jgi:hypothetical protein
MLFGHAKWRQASLHGRRAGNSRTAERLCHSLDGRTLTSSARARTLGLKGAEAILVAYRPARLSTLETHRAGHVGLTQWARSENSNFLKSFARIILHRD